MSTPIVALAAGTTATGFLGVDWSSIAEVCVVTLVATVAIVTIFAIGLRLLAVGAADDGGDDAMAARVARRPFGASLGGFVCVGLGGLAVLYGIYLVIPIFRA